MKAAASPTTTMSTPNEARVVEKGTRNDLMLHLGETVSVDKAVWGKLVSFMN